MLLLGSLAGGFGALSFGFSPEWDMLNYHLYNPHALLTGRMSIDVAPAQMQSYLNPLFHVPYYLAFRYLHPGAMVFVTGAVQGSQLLLLGLILRSLVGRRMVLSWMLWLVAALGLCGPIFLNELGATPGDTVLSIFVLGGLLLVLPDVSAQGRAKTRHAIVVCGILLGAAAALKLVIVIYTLALGVSLLLCGPTASRWQLTRHYTAGCVLGFLLAGGGWFAYLWWHYQNPFFPYFNQFFESSWIVESSFRDTRFMPRSALDWLAYPFLWLMEPQRVWEWPFRDVRVVVLYPLLFLTPLAFWRWLGRESPGLRLVLVFLAISYVMWLQVFSIYRYLSILELLAPAVLFALAVVGSGRRRVILTALVLLISSQFLVVYKRLPPLWELRANSPSSLATLPTNAMVIIDDYEPVAFTALWLDDAIPMVRIRANFMNQKLPVSRIHQYAEQRVRDHTGPIFLLQSNKPEDEPLQAADLARVGLAWNGPAACQSVFLEESLQRRTGLLLCSLNRLVEQPVQMAR